MIPGTQNPWSDVAASDPLGDGARVLNGQTKAGVCIAWSTAAST
jgi:hypothetical protein